jgi:hypothetical protein
MSPSHKVLGGFPSEMKVTLKYVETISLDAPSGSLAAYQFDPRNLYDPNVTSTGHQPSNFDRWMQIYNRWTVTSTTFELINAWNSSSSVTPAVWGFLVSKSGSQVTGLNPETIMEQPYVKYSNVPAGQANLTPFPGSLRARVQSSAWLGVNNAILKTPDYSGDGGTGPTTTFYIEVFAGTINGNDPGAVIFRVEMTFDAVFYEPKITVPS